MVHIPLNPSMTLSPSPTITAVSQPLTTIRTVLSRSNTLTPTNDRDDQGMIDRRSRWSRAWLMQDIAHDKATWPLVGFFFMSGWLNAIVFSAAYVWPGMQTGNTAQLGVALGRLFENGGADLRFHLADRFALCSLLSFALGALAARFGDRIGSSTRAWLATGTFLQAIMTAIAAVAIWQNGSESIALHRSHIIWHNAGAFATVGLVSASLGFQGVQARRLTTHFGATIVLTTTWVEFMSDIFLFNLRLAKSRDYRLMAIMSMLIGAMLGRGLLAVSSSAVTLAVAAAIRCIIAVSWIFVAGVPAPDASPGKDGKDKEKTSV